MAIQVIEKPWGKEEVLEINEHYMFKRLTMWQGHECSLQYHEFKIESVYLLSGSLKVYIGEDQHNLSELIMTEHEVITLKPFKVHRMKALTDTIYLEASTPEIDDVIRLQDRYERK